MVWIWPGGAGVNTATFRFGDVVSTSQPQGNLITVSNPTVPAAFSLIIDTKVFAYDAILGDTPEDIIAGLAATLLEDQTYVAVAISEDELTLLVQGPLAKVFVITGSANLDVALGQEAIEGWVPGTMRVLDSKEVFVKGSPTAPVTRRQTLLVRRMISGPIELTRLLRPGTDPLMYLSSEDVLTFVSRAEDTP